MQVVQCDGPRCDKLGPSEAAGWFVLFQMPGKPPSSVLSVLTGPSMETTGTFCSLPCVADYATVRALTDSAGEGQ